MSTVSESSYAKNIGNFNKMIEFVTGYGDLYKPTKDSLKIPNLIAARDSASGAVSLVSVQKASHADAVQNRKAAFDGLPELATRLIAALSATNASDDKIENLKSYNRKMRGDRTEPMPKADEAITGNMISVSQRSYDNLVEHFKGMVNVLGTESSFAPNEPDLSITALNSKVESLTAANYNVDKAAVSLSNARIARNNAINSKDGGMVDTAQEVKAYVKSVFGADSPQFIQLSALTFTRK